MVRHRSEDDGERRPPTEEPEDENARLKGRPAERMLDGVVLKGCLENS